jgi:hypothetical protein
LNTGKLSFVQKYFLSGTTAVVCMCCCLENGECKLNSRWQLGPHFCQNFASRVRGGNHQVLCTAMLTCDLYVHFSERREPLASHLISLTLLAGPGSFSRRWKSLFWSSTSSDCVARSFATVRYWTVHRVAWKRCLCKTGSLKDLEVDERVILKWILTKSIRRAWRGLIWLRIGAVVNAAMNLQIPKNEGNFVIGRATVDFLKKPLLQ